MIRKTFLAAALALASSAALAQDRPVIVGVGALQLGGARFDVRVTHTPIRAPFATIFISDRHAIRTNYTSAERAELLQLRALIDAAIAEVDAAPPQRPAPPPPQ